jgi:hypothetical protein
LREIFAPSSRAVCRRRFYKRKKSAAADFLDFIKFRIGFRAAKNFRKPLYTYPTLPQAGGLN